MQTFQCLLKFSLEVCEWMQGSRKVKNWQIDPKSSKGVMNVLTENNLHKHKQFLTSHKPLRPLKNHHDLQDPSNKNVASGCLVSLVSIGPFMTCNSISDPLITLSVPYSQLKLHLGINVSAFIKCL